MQWTVYILRSLKKKWYYVGSTNNMSRRLREHNKGLVRATKAHCPLFIIFNKNFNTEHEARLYEQKVKKCRKEKEGIIRQFETSSF